MAEGESSTQLIDGDGNFNDEGMELFSRTTGFSLCGLSYAVVAIMGPQSSGKSTLMNHMFRTQFREMDALRGRSQTTKGIWMARCLEIDPFTIAMDLEGTDGRERGEDDTTFEKQSALFALAVADIVLINTWCHDIGREQAANMPLLKTVFQVMMRLFIPRKITLLFVIRDLEMTPLEYLESILREDIRKIWDAVPKPEKHKLTPLSDFFNVEVTSLPSFYHRRDQFLEQVAQLRQRFFHSISPGGLAGDRRAVVPASSFSFSVQQIWKVVKENKDLDFPAHKVMLATVRCEDVLNEKLKLFAEDKGWLEMSDAVQREVVAEFGKKLSALLNTCMSEYEAETAFHDEGVRLTKGKQLREMILNLAYPSYVALLDHLYAKAIQGFAAKLEESLGKGEGFAAAVRACQNSCVAEFDIKCKDAAVEIADWNSSKVREKLLAAVASHAAEVRGKKLSELAQRYEIQLAEKLIEPVDSLLEAGGSDAWSCIRKRMKEETETAVAAFTKALNGFELDATTSGTLTGGLREHAKGLVEKKTREEAGKILIRMKDRFSTVFNHDNDSMPRVWTGKEDIRSITKDARSASLKLLSAVAALRFAEKGDTIENVLQSSLMGGDKSGKDKQIVPRIDPLASSSWPEVSEKDTIITPVQCRTLWRQFKSETEYAVTQAIAAQEAYKQSNNWLPPPWAIVALLVLGFNEFMLLLKNPLYLLVLFVVYLLSKALWVQLDIPGEFRHGAVSGILSVSSRLVPTVMNLLKRLSEEAQGNKSPPQDQSSVSSDMSSLSDGEDRPTTPARSRRAVSS